MRCKLPEGWEEVKLKEITEKVGAGSTPRGGSKVYREKGISFIRSQNILDFTFLKSGLVFIDMEAARKLNNVEILSNDILLNITGDSVARVCIVPEDILPARVNQHVAIVRTNDDLTYYKYVLYKLQDLKPTLLSYASSGATRKALTKSMIENLEISLPPLPEQKAIAATLSSLDDKIELNNQINENLEEQAQAIFKHWFLDFEFPDEDGNPYKSSGGEMVESELGMIPKGWEVKPLDEIAEFLNGVAIARFKPGTETKNENSLPAVKIRELRQGFTNSSSDMCLKTVDEKYIIDDYDMIFSWSGSLLIDIWVGGKAILNQHLFKVTSKEYDQWYYYYWTKHFLEEFIHIAKNKATTMGHINRSHLAEAKVLLPDKTAYREIGQAFSYILKLKMKNEKQNQTLAQLRDTLLPKLMSGEIRIPLD